MSSQEWFTEIFKPIQTPTDEERREALKGHKIQWFVYAGSDLVRRERSMRGRWGGWEAKCTCGWWSAGGQGQCKSSAQRSVHNHKVDVTYAYATVANELSAS